MTVTIREDKSRREEARAGGEEAAHARPAGHGGLLLAVLWAAAMGCVALTAANYHAIALAADRLEVMERAGAGNAAGRGECARYEAAQPPMMFDPDSLCWIALTQNQIAEGSLRPRTYPYDNAPYGHRQHWSASFNWWLLLVGGATSLLTGLPWAQGVAQSAAWANPVLLACFLTALALALRRRLAAWPLGILLVTLATAYNVEWDFSYGRPDHHGLHLMAFTGTLLGVLAGGMGWALVEASSFKLQASRKGEGKKFKVQVGEKEAGWNLVQPRAPGEAQGWFAASGVCGGMGLWIGSTQQCICIAALGAGAVLGGLLFARREGEGGVAYEPGLWRLWARTGAAASLFFYLLEGLPNHFEMRLEVNHPFISLGWLGAGELMYVLLRFKVQGSRLKEGRGKAEGRRQKAEGANPRFGWQILLGLLGMSVLPLALVFGPKKWCVLADPLLARTTQLVTEGRPWIDPLNWATARHLVWVGTGTLLLGLPLAVALTAWRRRKLPPWQSAGMTAGAVTAAALLGWTLWQNRWLGFLEVSLAVLAVLTAPGVPLPSALTRRSGALLVLLALTAPSWAAFAQLRSEMLAGNPLTQARATLGGVISSKEVAWNLRRAAEGLRLGRPARVMAPPAAGPVLHYYGGVDAVGSYYWDNLAGCRAGVGFFMDETGETARNMARERGLDFVVVTNQPASVLEWQWLQRGRTDLRAAERTLAFRLSNALHAQPPPWLEAVPLADAPLAERAGVRLYRVVKERL